MPTLSNPSGSVRVPAPLDGVSARGPTTRANKVLSTITPVASTGNSVDDHLEDIKAELGHRTDNDEFQGEYSSTATYAIGDEVTWTDGDGKKLFFKRIVAGDDEGTGNPTTNTANWINISANINDITIGDYGFSVNSGLLERLQNGTIRFNRRAVEVLSAAVTEASAQTLINDSIKEVVENGLWRGEWQAGTYSVGEFVVDNGDYFRANNNIGPVSTTAPASDTTNWTQLTPGGYHYDIANRLEDITNLLAERTFLVPAAANRGQWPARRPDSEAGQYVNPPMQWKGDWQSGASYFFGDVVNHNTRVWVLTASATRTTPRRGSSTTPGTDSAWTQIVVGHTSDVPGWRGAWVDLAGTVIRQGDLATHQGNYYISRTNQAQRGSEGPDADPTNWDLLDIVLGDYQANEYWPEGGITSYQDNWWYSTEAVGPSDPAPGAADDTKWLQIGGYATTDDVEQLRRDVQDLAHGARTSRGTLVDGLEEPPTANSETEVWLPRKASRSYTAPSTLISGSSDYTQGIGDEPGQYVLRQSEANKAGGVVGRYTTSASRRWYGIFSRAEDGAPWPRDIGRWVENPLGSAFLGVGTEQTGNSSWTNHLLIKRNVLFAIGAGSEPTSLYVQINDDTDVVHSIHLTTLANTFSFHDVQYRHMTGPATGRGAFGDQYENGSGDGDRAVEVALAFTAAGAIRWLGDRQYHWVRQPPITNSDEIPIVSDDFHTAQVMSRSQYQALTTLPPRSLILIYENS